MLAAHFIKELNKRHDKRVTEIAEPVRKALSACPWEGNVRELRNTIESMVVQDVDGVLNVDDYGEDNPLANCRCRTAATPGRTVWWVGRSAKWSVITSKSAGVGERQP